MFIVGGVETTQTMEDNIGRVDDVDIAKEDMEGWRAWTPRRRTLEG